MTVLLVQTSPGNDVRNEGITSAQLTKVADAAVEGPLLQLLDRAEALARSDVAMQPSAEGLRRRIERRLGNAKKLKQYRVLFETTIMSTLWEPHEPAMAPSWTPAPRRTLFMCTVK
mmetsp:Transcript_81716/g.162205  ORF Transcript_81716/g.162205 Transcript_81716/m.162205 type:complete len:116 (+) Transcript_81716:48-395(+)